ncbi:outer membrane protein [Paracoccus lutimaris]|uniref:Outer membrane immunogenic protein n=1 Tax=Paracoccus lutimaris TaxID=1490030 RepID=A0A368YP48_9RHOB|nr:outer membrane beta-barrel protein [Paracoccus lutimaris]RCW79924.1 outer membrane immunogenic protein [Paracoccus lutimaris]
MSALRSKALVAATLSLATTATAFAGGYAAPVVDPVVAPIVESAPADWQGGYAGLTLGYAFNGDDEVGIDQPPRGSGAGTPDELTLSGANAGLRVGYRWQRDRWVFGPELGYEGGDIKDDFSTAGYDAESKIKNVLALRFKTGYVLNNGVMLYGIVGAARAKIDYKVEGDGEHGAIDLNDDYSENGYIVGFGAEKMLTERLSLTGEYEYANFGKKTLSDDADVATRATPKYHNVKVGLNFKF